MIHNLLFTNKTDNPDMAIGLVVAKHLHIHHPIPALESNLRNVLELRLGELSEQEEKMRQAARDMLRTDEFKPTGRSKPASEYLLREAREGRFPRINSAVDTINTLSLKYMVPISLWDLDLAAATHYVFRLGEEEEEYVFNDGDQAIKLNGLVVGCRVRSKGEEPIINPVKDSLQTKTTPSTRNIGVAIYFPLKGADKSELRAIIRECIALLEGITKEEPEYDIL